MLTKFLTILTYCFFHVSNLSFAWFSMPVKEERDDEEEINELARKIAETNRQKLVQAQLYQHAQLTGPVALAR